MFLQNQTPETTQASFNSSTLHSIFMANTTSIALTVFLLISTLYTAWAQTKASSISLDSSLTPTGPSTWPSPSRTYTFGFFPRGQGGYSVGVFLESTVVWTANRDLPPVPNNSTLLLTNDGKLTLDGVPILDPSDSISSASMLDSGNFVLYNSAGDIIWQSFDHPTDTILPGQILRPGQELVASISGSDFSSGIFRLKMQNDGNLIQYPVGTPDIDVYSYYTSFTDKVGSNVTLNLDRDGNLYLMKSSVFLKNLTQGGGGSGDKYIFLMRIDADGIFRVYSRNKSGGNWSVTWKSSSDKCDPKGLCGLNAFCISIDDNVDCRCLPGFDFINPGNRRFGCERNFIAQSCKRNDAFSMAELGNTMWEDISYSQLSSLTKSDCQDSCLRDCNCEAALFKDGTCRKQRLPLRFGRRLLSDSNTAFIKVGNASASPEEGTSSFLHGQRKERLPILITGTSLMAVASLMIAVSVVLIHRNRLSLYETVSSKGSSNRYIYEDLAPRLFTYVELERITEGFQEEIGRGACGTVYKGKLPENNEKLVAVKRVDKVLEEGDREFQTEIKVIGKTHHRNLVRLVGYCLEGTKKLLVYEYMSNGSLADVLFNNQKSRLDWNERIRIALAITRGILYLHDECETQIIHCDIKPQNILMDHQGCTKISDFGLAKLLIHDQTKTFTGIRGTKGYVAPEWHRGMPITAKADVYSFGIMLLEIICCRRCLDWSLKKEEAVLDEWVYDRFLDGELDKIVGDEVVDGRRLERTVRVALWCIQDDPLMRPSMRKVQLMLEGTVDIPVPPSPTSFLSSV